jgi:trans-AT polyketide synthase/acyltransferase/oxidoreductase domain-containing protein
VTELIVREKAGRCRPLKVSAAFHSRYMRPAAAEFADFLPSLPLADPPLPVIANVTAEPYRPGELSRLLAQQISSSVRWADSMRFLVQNGVRDVVELGPGTVLSRLWVTALDLQFPDTILPQK